MGPSEFAVIVRATAGTSPPMRRGPGGTAPRSISRGGMNEQACNLCRGAGGPGARLRHAFPKLGGSRLARPRLVWRTRRERLCRTAVGLRPALSLLGRRLCLRLPLRLLSLLAPALAPRLVLGTRAS